MRGVFVGVLALAGLEAVVSSQQSASRAGTLVSFFGALVNRLLDPTVPAIPQLFVDPAPAGSSSSSQTAAATSAGGTQLVSTPAHPTVTTTLV